jgi:hypothetical protein
MTDGKPENGNNFHFLGTLSEAPAFRWVELMPSIEAPFPTSAGKVLWRGRERK